MPLIVDELRAAAYYLRHGWHTTVGGKTQYVNEEREALEERKRTELLKALGKGRYTVKDLVARLDDQSKPSVTGRLERLEKLGYVQRSSGKSSVRNPTMWWKV